MYYLATTVDTQGNRTFKDFQRKFERRILNIKLRERERERERVIESSNRSEETIQCKTSKTTGIGWFVDQWIIL